MWCDAPPDMIWSMPFSIYAHIVARSALAGGMGSCWLLEISADMTRNIGDQNIEEGERIKSAMGTYVCCSARVLRSRAAPALAHGPFN